MNNTPNYSTQCDTPGYCVVHHIGNKIHWASKETSLLQSVTHWNPKHLHGSYLDTDWLNLSLINVSKKSKVYFIQRGDKCDEIARGQFSKITETACLSGWECEADKSWYGIHVTRHWNWMNSYILNVLNRLPPWSSLSEQFLQFSKNDPSWFNHNCLPFDTKKSCVFQIFLLWSIKA